VIDQIYNEALRYSARGESLGTVPDTVEPSLERFFPLEVKTQGSNLIFQLSGNRLKTIDRNYESLADVSFSASPSLSSQSAQNPLPRIGSLWLWQPVGGKDIVSFSDIELPAREAGARSTWKCGFLRFPVAEPWQFKVLGAEGMLPYDSSLRLYNRLGHEYIAGLGSTAFILRMDKPITIFRQTAGSAQLKPLPSDWLKIALPGVTEPPSLPKFDSPKQIAEVMAAVEASSMPVGLYAWDRSLFVMTRAYDHGSTEWRITKIDPVTSRTMGTATIPVNAHHLTVVPGPNRWAFIEKGPITGWNDYQEIPSIFFVPTERFTKPLSGDICSD
jgi:hypothetical protein